MCFFVACPCAFRDRCELDKVGCIACTYSFAADPLTPNVRVCRTLLHSCFVPTSNFRRAVRGASGRRPNQASGSTLSANRINSKDSITGRQFLLSELSSSIARNQPHQQRFVWGFLFWCKIFWPIGFVDSFEMRRIMSLCRKE